MCHMKYKQEVFESHPHKAKNSIFIDDQAEL